ncbi:hypothetical protein FW774_02725 (plasmid) [Pedobacter sp. BS3]|nr:hypothetical protein FW774_02725 [Pedobacter sp. BS3]
MITKLPTYKAYQRYVLNMMNQTDIFKKIGSILDEITEQYHYLAKNQENLNELELELFSANASFLADHIEILRRLNAAKPHTKPTPNHIPSVNPESTPVGPEKQPEAAQQEEPEQAAQPEAHETGQPETTEPVTGQENATDKQEPVRFVLEADPIEDKPEEAAAETITPEPEETAPVAEPVTQATQQEPEAESTVVNEVVIQEKTVSIDIPPAEETGISTITEPAKAPTLNELISAQREGSTRAGQFIQQPVTDLKSIISLNDKLMFVKDLFNGYSLAYSEAIELVNRFDTFEAADNFLQTNYAAKNNWAEKQATVDKLYELLNRRFSR